MELIWTLQSLDLVAVLDILLIATVLFGLSFALRGTQAVPVMRGMIVVVILMTFLSTIPNLVAFRWLTGVIITGAAVAIPVIFQPEIRRGMERIGRAGFSLRTTYRSDIDQMIEDVSIAAGKLSERRHGALIVLARAHPLDEFIATGIQLDSEISPQLLLTIFYPKTELHDGAVIIRERRICSAAAVLPLSAAHGLAQRKVGTRHRAAIGLSEICDAIVVVVSEETGQISVANGGRMIRRLDSTRLQTILRAFYTTETAPEEKSFWTSLWEQILRRPPKDSQSKQAGEQTREAA